MILEGKKNWFQVLYEQIANEISTHNNISVGKNRNDEQSLQLSIFPRRINKSATLIICRNCGLHAAFLSNSQIGGWTSSGGLAIDDITWPGNSPSPPSGRPAKYHLKVVTLKEPPYVNYIDPDPATGLCPPMAVSCRITPVGNDSSP